MLDTKIYHKVYHSTINVIIFDIKATKMLHLNQQYITDKNGKKISVVLPIEDFEAILEELEELDDIKLFDSAKRTNETSLLAEEAFKIIESNRKKAQ